MPYLCVFWRFANAYDEYNKRGEQQLIGYLEDYHVDKGYMLSFNFNRKKQSGIRKIIVNGKTIVEAVV